MPDAVTTNVQVNGARNYQATFTNISDGTGENAVVKIDKSTLVNELRKEPARLNILRVQWSINGFSSVRILWDHTTDDVGMVLATGQGFHDFGQCGPIIDPNSAGGTGDVLFTTAGATIGATYDITLWVRKAGSV
jgi:hypothetical protein